MKYTKRLLALAVTSALAAPMAANATNGMNLEGYGAIAAGMGGASMAYDNGTAAVMNNPATLGLMGDGNRLDVALGNLRPNVAVEAGPASWKSGSDSFFMPAVGWAHKEGELTYGVGMFAQGGMGTNYDESGMFGASPGGAMSAGVAGDNIAYLNSFVVPGNPMYPQAHVSVDQAMGGTASLTDYANTIAGDAASLQEFSEVSVGRLVVPVAYAIDDNLTVGGSVDFVWAGMDLKMAMPGSLMQDMMPMPGSTQSAGTMTGGLINAMGGMFFDPTVHNFSSATGMPSQENFGLSGLNYGYFDFADSSDYTGKAQGNGFAAKLGFTYKFDSKLKVGGTFHSKTSMGDLEASGANVSMSVLMTTLDTNTGTLMTMPTDVDMVGTVKVKDFQWPQTIGLGVSYQATEALMIAADVKQVAWSGVMKDFVLGFEADSVEMGGQDVTAMFAGNTDMEATLYQNWDDQLVLSLGGAYAVTKETTLRAGLNYAENPIGWETLHYLFPAITQTHVTLGAGHAIDSANSIDFALSVVPETKRWMNGGADVSMDQTNWQLMYSYKF